MTGPAPPARRRPRPDSRGPRPNRPAQRRAADPARRAAYDLLRAVEERDAYANLTLPALLRERGLAGRDAAFATELGYGTLRATGTLDAILARCADRPLDALDPEVLAALRLGTYQLLRTRVPAHAAVSATVDLAPRRAAGFVNAVLRRVARQGWDSWVSTIAPPLAADPLGHLAVRYAHPKWVAAAFHDALGGDLAETEAALAADDRRPETHLVARPGRISRDRLAALSGGEPGPWSPYAVRLSGGGDPGALAPVRDGRAGVQDEGSQLTALALAAVPLDGPDRTWLDLCAGPGGKATLLGCLAAGPAGVAEAAAPIRVLAVEKAAHRARLVAAATGGLPVDVIQADGVVPAWRPGSFDRALLDAPCTGLGALRRRPEARWRRRESDLPRLTRLQRSLLRSALAAARPGGVIAYVVCSPHPAETREVLSDVLADGTADQLDARPLFPGVPDLDDGPQVQLWPHRHGTDAMFCALLLRR
ncbi:MAG TPA: transcription antitermination factor NusB [Mycobacteriales bacterium]|nr:transcription antitermination factor NusB [Mycobacteriales bacterium]